MSVLKVYGYGKHVVGTHIVKLLLQDIFFEDQVLFCAAALSCISILAHNMPEVKSLFMNCGYNFSEQFNPVFNLTARLREREILRVSPHQLLDDSVQKGGESFRRLAILTVQPFAYDRVASLVKEEAEVFPLAG